MITSGKTQYYDWQGIQQDVWDVDGADFVIPHLYFDIYTSEKYGDQGQQHTLLDSFGKPYIVEIIYSEGDTRVRLTGDENQELALVSISEFLDLTIADPSEISLLSKDQMRLTSVFEGGKFTIAFQTLSASVTDESSTYSAEFFILVYLD